MDEKHLTDSNAMKKARCHFMLCCAQHEMDEHFPHRMRKDEAKKTDDIARTFL
jgi:hypothetical protein